VEAAIAAASVADPAVHQSAVAKWRSGHHRTSWHDVDEVSFGSDADVVVLCLHSGSKRTADVKESASDGEPLGRSDNERCGRRGAHADRRLSTVRPCGFGSGQSSNQQHLHGRLNRQELHGSPSIRSDRF